MLKTTQFILLYVLKAIREPTLPHALHNLISVKALAPSIIFGYEGRKNPTWVVPAPSP